MARPASAHRHVTVARYHLGDWTESWEKFAKRAAATGDWELCRETRARQRSDVAMPETSTRAIVR
jgi:hypothetical protein